MSNFILSFNLFGEFDHFEDWDAAVAKERREYKKKQMRHKEVTPEELNSLEQRSPTPGPQTGTGPHRKNK